MISFSLINWLLALGISCTAPLPQLAGNWKGHATDHTRSSPLTMLFILYQTDSSLNGYTRSYLQPGAYAECRISGSIDGALQQVYLREDSTIRLKNTGMYRPLIYEAYRLRWNAAGDTLRGHTYEIRKGKTMKQKSRKVLLWRVPG